MGALDHPVTPSESGSSLNAALSNPRPDPARPTPLPPHSGVVGLVGVQLVGTLASTPPAALQRDGVQRRSNQWAVVAVGASQDEAERRATRVGDEVALGARLTRIAAAGTRRKLTGVIRRCPGDARNYLGVIFRHARFPPPYL